MTRILISILASLLTLGAAEISGKWTGTVKLTTSDGEAMTVPLLADFHQKGQELTGTIGRHAAEKDPVSNGKVEGDKVSFEVSTTDSGVPFKFELNLANDALEGKMKGQIENGPVTGNVALKREPSGAQ